MVPRMLSIFRISRQVLLSAAIVAGLAACEAEEQSPSTDTGTTDTGTTDTGTTDDVADTEETDTSEVMEDTTFRVTFVDIVKPGGVGPILGNLINSDIEDQALHILIQVLDFAAAWPATFTVSGNAGQAVYDGETIIGYTWYDGVEVDYATASIDADGVFDSDETLSITFPALEPGATEPLEIPVSDLQLSGELFAVGSGWGIEGTLEGAILASEIEGIEVDLGTPQPLSQLLGGEDKMDYPDGATGDALTGWKLEADIVAESVTFVEPAE